jgi:hypothetical protein
VVIFSQWVRMHELVARRLERHKWRHVLFHGGVPGPQRKGLIQRFKEEPDCRLFLSTDAGGVGLNLQHASVVVNLDQPWNPAVLEQRIGRVHRLGQHRPVRVVHFISQGTIEEGMLGLLAFKKSVFTGVLDDGQDEVFMGGTRLKRFMESVEKATTTIPQAMPQAAEPGTGADVAEAADVTEAAEVAQSIEAAVAASPAGLIRPSHEQVWADVFSAGMSLVERIGKLLIPGQAEGQTSPAGPAFARGLPAGMIGRDEQTGQPCLKLPLPPPETMQKIVELLSALGSSGSR